MVFNRNFEGEKALVVVISLDLEEDWRIRRDHDSHAVCNPLDHPATSLDVATPWIMTRGELLEFADSI